ncbi:MAG TPA: sortase [Anaerolineales bacterium]|nr:sortase [Anaerolineales bacterium]HNQ93245.1 sortase [Anaerolineales bacterium]HNS60679.1 sortase [Anaerolineales bacterium]
MKKLNKLAGIFATITILLFSLFSTPKSAGASCAPNHIIYVASSGSGAGGCTWATAFPLLQDAITLATSGDQIWVASGTYYPDEGAGQINNDRNSTFTLKNGVSVYGGFSVGDALLTDRDSNPAINGTVLSGDIDQVAGNANNAYTVVTTNGFLADTYVLDGFTITGGNQNSGSGVGGGMYIQNTSPTLANLIITANNANGRGGGVFIISVSAVEANYSNTSFTDVTVSNNTAGIGGGVYVQNGSPSFTRVTFTGNSSASGAGGGLNVQTLGGPGVDEPNLPTLLDVVFTSNTSVGGGGMFNNNSQSTLNRVTFSGNTATRRGGGMLNEFSSPTLTNVTFSGNISTETSAATTPWGGGGIMNIGADPVLNNVTFNGNNSVNGSGTAGGDAIKNVTQTGNASAPVIENSILWGDGGINDEVRSEGTSSATIEDSIVQGGCPALATCTNVINSNPVLSALVNNGGYTQTMAISVTGAADDAADTTTADCAAVDQRGTARPQGVACDIGAYEIDDTGAPTLISFTRFNPATTPTNADTLVFRATFSETVLNVSAGDFQVNGTTTATVTLITPVSGTVYEITVSGGDLAGFNGVVGIDLSGAQNITDSVGNALPAGEPATDETYTLDNNAPALQSFTRFNPLTSPTNADTLVFRATFNETVLNVSAGDFAVNGATTATVTLVTAISGTVYEITVSGGDLAGFNGMVGLNLAGAQDITDSAGNSLPTGEPLTDETYTLDNSAPALISFTRQTPATSPTNADTLVFRATFSETVVNVSVGDFAVNGTTTATVTLVTPISGTTYDITVSGGDLAGFNGVVGLDLAGAQDITDSVGNALPAGEPATDETYILDNFAPTLTSFTRQTPATSPTNADTLVFRATFSETVVNVSVGDFAVNGATTATVTLVTPISGTVYDITVSGGDLAGFNGVVGIDLSGAQDITDSVGNALPAGEPATDETYTLDNSAPALNSFVRQNPATSPTNADTLVFRATFSETVINVSAADFAVNGATTATVTLVTPISGTVYDITVSGGDLAGFNGVVGLDLSGAQDITDSVGNALPAGEPAIDEAYTLDNSGPVLTSFTRQTPATTPTNADTLVFRATFSETVINVSVGDFAVNGATTAAVTLVTPVSGTAYDITVSGGDLAGFNGVVGLDLSGAQDITDSLGNALPAGEPAIDETYTLDNSAPALTSFARQTPATSPTNADTLVFRATFSETVVNVSVGDFAVNGATTATVTLVTLVSGTVYDITVSGGDLAGFNGVVGIDLSGAQDITDSVGNALPAGEPATDETYTVDNTSTALTSFTRQTPATSPTNADTLVFRATFSEDMLNVDTGDFTVNGTTTATVTLVTPVSGSVYDITVSGGDLAGFNGVVGIDLSGAQDITDSVGNALPAGEPATDETFIVDNSGPIVTASVPANTATVTGPTQLTVTYNEDVKNDASAGAANNIVNYLLVEAGANATFDTLSCVGGVVADDTVITINTATYTNNGGSGPFIATLDINGGIALPVGTYQLYVCGTTSIENLINLELNDGLADTIIQFTVIAGGAGGGGGGGSTPANQRSAVPATGFPQGILTTLPLQPAEKAYTATSLWIEIPRLGVKMNIVGIPQTKDGWDVTWLARDAGWLNGSAFPTWQGNSVLTGHVWTETNKPGPFNKLKDLQYGDQVKIHAFGQVFIYEIRESALISSTDTKSMMKHEEKTWLTLITCEGFNAKTGDYLYRRMARAVLVSVIADQ